MYLIVCILYVLVQLENGSLVILSASVHEEGLYTCQVTNRAGSAEAHIRIEVKGGSVVGTGGHGVTIIICLH